MKRHPVMKFVWSYAVITVACVIYALGFNWCYAPNSIAFGGLTGIAQIIHAMVGVPSVGVLIIILNIIMDVHDAALRRGEITLGVRT